MKKRLIALLLLAVMVLVPVAAGAIKVEIVTGDEEPEDPAPVVDPGDADPVAHCVDEYAAIEAAHAVRVAAVADLGAKKEAAIAAIARYNEAKSELAKAKAAMEAAEATLAAALEGGDAEYIKDAEWRVAREKAVFDKWAAAVVSTKAAMEAAEAAWKAAVAAYEAAVAAENAAIRAYNRCAASNLPLVSVDPALVGGVVAGAVPKAGALK